MKTILNLTLLTLYLVISTDVASQTKSITDNPAVQPINMPDISSSDYALYQYTTEMLQRFHKQLEADINAQLRRDTLQLINSQQQMTPWKSPYANEQTAATDLSPE